MYWLLGHIYVHPYKLSSCFQNDWDIDDDYKWWGLRAFLSENLIQKTCSLFSETEYNFKIHFSIVVYFNKKRSTRMISIELINFMELSRYSKQSSLLVIIFYTQTVQIFWYIQLTSIGSLFIGLYYFPIWMRRRGIQDDLYEHVRCYEIRVHNWFSFIFILRKR